MRDEQKNFKLVNSNLFLFIPHPSALIPSSPLDPQTPFHLEFKIPPCDLASTGVLHAGWERDEAGNLWLSSNPFASNPRASLVKDARFSRIVNLLH
jgi:hypothetical protein